MLERIAIVLLIASPMAMTGAGQSGYRQLTQHVLESWPRQMQALVAEMQQFKRDQAEEVELDLRLLEQKADEITKLAARRQLQDCQQKRRLIEEGQPPYPAVYRRCVPTVQTWFLLREARVWLGRI